MSENDEWNDSDSVSIEDGYEESEPILQFFIGLWITMLLGFCLAALWVVFIA